MHYPELDLYLYRAINSRAELPSGWYVRRRYDSATIYDGAGRLVARASIFEDGSCIFAFEELDDSNIHQLVRAFVEHTR